MPTVLFVCTANQCRSPIAAALFTEQANTRGQGERWKVRSAGTWAVDGSPAASLAIRVMAERGLDISTHCSRTLQAADLDDADLILVMTRNQRESILAEFPNVGHKIHLLSQMIGYEYDIGDPSGGDRYEYKSCAEGIRHLIGDGFDQIMTLAKYGEEQESLYRGQSS